MSAARHIDHRLPAEPPSDPVNAMLDLAESAIRTIVEHGAEAQLRARLARLLPSQAPPPPAPAPPVASASSWEWTQVLTALRAARSPSAHTAAAREIAARHLAAVTAFERHAALAAHTPQHPTKDIAR